MKTTNQNSNKLFYLPFAIIFIIITVVSTYNHIQRNFEGKWSKRVKAGPKIIFQDDDWKVIVFDLLKRYEVMVSDLIKFPEVRKFSEKSLMKFHTDPVILERVRQIQNDIKNSNKPSRLIFMNYIFLWKSYLSISVNLDYISEYQKCQKKQKSLLISARKIA